MDDHVRRLLEEKAAEISRYFHAAGYLHTYRVIDHGVNFMLLYAGNEHTLALFYSPKKRRWTLYSVNEWIQDVVIPLIQPLLGEARPQGPKQAVTNIETEAPVVLEDVYFAEARECLRVLEPFSKENIDFSIICDFARRGAQLVLRDPRHAHLDRAALQELLELPSQSNFHLAKEYLFQCLTRCNNPIEK